jgi:hypothetical protein
MSKRKPKPTPPQPLKMNPDPYYQETPWEIVLDDKGRVIGEIFTLPARMTRRSNERADNRNTKRNTRLY